ncbi:bifunctional [glutamine synthetase] adenylyltransferase/[glutamine synthetase]-adenylyl-L-tyrosine phosphorylase [Alsobacter sp. SYSU M60028]|uniref:Bifunctional glutamine synthetase adenylyltransferase/adenylyl-removing enzyme n=1 Tax=Alsobacter ponti TaxID=2962936 RepID=A0ABT1L8A0_9HYPH|nr:bifunctional [glutamine synthetase] adenylyltransferase/[glutamine synthetase]-adenylyl-L-tyrosine phosphorylase [Alsobacter ponti]MCP8937722.1 bifunctional [glutamine synthetase] adenylyltransferase/[glutamine synthetase]-adenylyl-L-tyrosine phosphorylase [Alsobacter ponti]
MDAVSPTSLASALVAAPRVADRKAAERRLADLLEEARETELPALVEASPAVRDVLLGLADHSPFLWRLCRLDPARLAALFAADPGERLAALLAATEAAWRSPHESEVMRALRLGKQELALLVALADIGGAWGVERVTEALAAYADAACACSVRFLLAQAAESGRCLPRDADDPARECGMVVIALGKHGARELNYSSDIDVVVFFDAERAPLAEHIEAGPFFVRLVKGLVKLMQERTADGYVFRTDLRLRPDPASTPTAIALASAFAYYETVGQNWERAALIKARPVAGDLPIGEAFLADLAPFIWRKYFDFAAIADIHAMKRQIHAVRGHEKIAVAGHNIKLGRGGIREIEFFVQTQQLVFGGRRPNLRGRRTLDMLGALRADGWISPEAEAELSDAYRLLRTLEHRLQMLEDEQTQTLPSDADALSRFARFCGYADVRRFSKALTDEAQRVEKHYARLFEEGGELTVAEGSLVFTGTTDDPETLTTLRRMGFIHPAEVAETVRGWHFGRRQAVTSPRAREVLTELVPPLLAAFGETPDPDGALVAFDRALGRMPAAVELFSILKSHKSVLRLFADILGSAPRLAEQVAGRPHLLDAIIDPAFAGPPPDAAALTARLAEAVGEPELLEEALDRLRETGQHMIFVVGARAISGTLSLEQAGAAYADVAEAVIRVALADVARRFEAEHGRVPGGRMAVVGMGRLGSREMTATSDLDLVSLYDFEEDRAESDGPRPLNAVVYYTRLTQRLISALTVPTRKGVLYAVDMRLRPSGNKGPAATQFKGFVSYQQSEAETWEHLALVRARPVAGDAGLIADAQAAISAVLARPRDPAKLRADARDMRALIAREKGDADPWDLKLVSGGLLDIEFVAQTLVLAHAAAHPEIAATATGEVLSRAVRLGLIDANDGETLRQGYALMRDLFQWQRLSVSGGFDPNEAASGLKRRMATVVGLPDFKVLARDLADTRAQVREVYQRFMKG